MFDNEEETPWERATWKFWAFLEGLDEAELRVLDAMLVAMRPVPSRSVTEIVASGNQMPVAPPVALGEDE